MTIQRRGLVAALSFGALAAWASSAAAQDSAAGSAVEGEFSVQRFEPAPGPRNYLSVEGARMNRTVGVHAGVLFNYAHEPFVIAECASETDCEVEPGGRGDNAVVSSLYTFDLLAAVVPISPLQIGLRLPLAYVSGSGLNPATGGPGAEPIGTFAMGDPTLEGKLRVVGKANDPTVLGVALDLSAPLGANAFEGSYVGSKTPLTAGLRGIYDGKFGPFSLALNLKGVLREASRIGSTTVGPEFRYGVGTGYQFSPVFRMIAEGFGSTRFSSASGSSALEVDGAAQITPGPVVLTLGGGFGVVAGVGVPAFRVIAGIGFSNEVSGPDEDNDGVANDRCPTVPEDFDGFEDDDGCKDDDNDGDSVPDAKDKCEGEQETINGFKDDDGCPDRGPPDMDKDGVGDEEDKCPNQAGRLREGENKGCPDSDSDGIADNFDKCIDEAEDGKGDEPQDGCAEK